MPIHLVRDCGRVKDGGSCAVCNNDYIGVGVDNFYPNERKGYRIEGESNNIIEPYNLCEECYNQIKMFGCIG